MNTWSNTGVLSGRAGARPKRRQRFDTRCQGGKNIGARADNEQELATYAIVAFLNLDENRWVEALRAQYDPLAHRVAAHLTLVHPITTTLAQQELLGHIQAVSRETRPIALKLQGITGHLGEYLFLNVKLGNDQVIALRDALYSGPLEAFREPLVTFVPHVTVGRLSSRDRFQEALSVTRAYTEPVVTVADALTCYRIHDDGRRVILHQAQLSG